MQLNVTREVLALVVGALLVFSGGIILGSLISGGEGDATTAGVSTQQQTLTGKVKSPKGGGFTLESPAGETSVKYGKKAKFVSSQGGTSGTTGGIAPPAIGPGIASGTGATLSGSPIKKSEIKEGDQVTVQGTVNEDGDFVAIAVQKQAPAPTPSPSPSPSPTSSSSPAGAPPAGTAAPRP